jgi:hypothetical protein
MFKRLLIAAIILVPALAHAGARLTAMETRWLKAAGPVLAYAQRLHLPIDIIVQPTARPTDVPLAMGFMDGRCKLVLSMRGNPDAEQVLDKVPQDRHGVLMEAMAAHEVGHCWRYAQGVWHALPAGFTETAGAPALPPESAALRDNRREEGFADMVALAWTKRFHPDSYGQVYAWLAAVRSEQPAPGGGHDTRTWVRLARDGSVFSRAPHRSTMPELPGSRVCWTTSELVGFSPTYCR